MCVELASKTSLLKFASNALIRISIKNIIISQLSLMIIVNVDYLISLRTCALSTPRSAPNGKLLSLKIISCIWCFWFNFSIFLYPKMPTKRNSTLPNSENV